MTNLTLVIEAAKLLITQHEKYTTNPTKAESKRIRASIAGIQRVAVTAKRELLAADEATPKATKPVKM
jgi:hypothetical protein